VIGFCSSVNLSCKKVFSIICLFPPESGSFEYIFFFPSRARLFSPLRKLISEGKLASRSRDKLVKQLGEREPI
jgi:hypothetical protein